MNTWKRLDEIEANMHQVNQYIFDLKSQRAQEMTNPPALTLSEDVGEPWLVMSDDKLERLR